ncbi:Unc-93-like protein A [Elysia marginata]|uniref:Unc-93-like protein A n=1 Tax=Elysia marginata TaxID=1093978 RepID=A0AAV4HJH4_9GAST|nr:Unc-93-like protein A [Elysia marginata]
MPRFSRVKTTSTDSDNTVPSRSQNVFGDRGASSASNSNAIGSNSSNNNGIGPFGISGLGMGFGLYRPRRPSYTLATQACRQRSESYRYATRRANPDIVTDIDVLDGEDFIDGVIKRSSRQASLIREASGSREQEEGEREQGEGLQVQCNYDNDDDDDDDNVIVTSAAAAAVSRAMTPESRVAVFITDEDEESGTTTTFNLPQSSFSEQFTLQPTKQVPADNSYCNRNVPNHLSLYSPHYPSVSRQIPENSLAVSPLAKGNGTTPTLGKARPLCDHRSPHSPHNDLAHAIPLPPEAISRKRKPLKRSFACGEAETDDLERDLTLSAVSVPVTSPNTAKTTTPDSNGSNNCETETVVVGLLTPANGRANNVTNGSNKGSSTNSQRRQNSNNMLLKKHTLPVISSFTFTKNLLVLCLGFIFVYSSFRAIQNLQSSVNGGQDLGVITMTIVHISMVFASLLAPIIINVFTAKWAMCGGIMCFLAWFGAHIHPTFWTLVPTSVMVGLGQAVIWNAESAYVLKLAFDSATAAGGVGSLDQEMFRFHGIFLACFQSTHIWGNLISSLMLSWYKGQLLKARDSQEPMRYPVYSGVGNDGAVVMDTAGDYGNALGNGSLSDPYSQGYGDSDYGDIAIGVYCGTLHRCTPGQDQLLPDIFPGEISVGLCSQGLGPNDNLRAATQRLAGIPGLSLSQSHYTDTDPTSGGSDCARLCFEPATSWPRSEATTN